MGRISRRNVLKASGSLGTFALAGCLGGDGDGNGDGGGGGTTSIAVGIPSASTTTGQASNGFQQVVQDVSADTEPAGTITWNNQETGGDPPSLRQLNQGNVDAMTGGNFIIASAMEDLPPFEEKPVEAVPYQGFKIASLHLQIAAIDGSGIETTDDLAGNTVWPLPPQWGLRQHVETVFQNAGIWDEIEVVNAGTGDVAGAIDENRIDAFVAYGAEFANLPGWATEVDARADLHLVELTDTFEQGINSTRGTNFREIEVYGWEQDMGVDTIGTFPSDFQFFFSEGISRDVGYELAKISHENVQAIQESQPAYADHSDIENMTDIYLEDLGVHGGVADFLEENDAWNEDWERGEVSE